MIGIDVQRIKQRLAEELPSREEDIALGLVQARWYGLVDRKNLG